MSGSTLALYGAALGGLLVSYCASKERTRVATRKAVAAFLNVLPEFAAVLGLVGLMLTFVSPATISKLLGSDSGLFGLLLASLVGSITLIPGFVAFPLAATLLRQGAGVVQVAVFISTLMMVGFVTFPLEKRYFGQRAALWRNATAYIWSFAAALVIGLVVTR